MARAVGTAKTHSGLAPGAPSAEQVLDFLGALACGAASDRGCARKGRAKDKVRSLRFLSFKLGLKQLCDILSGPVVEAWLAADKWDKLPVREALPLPLSIVARLELVMGTAQMRMFGLLARSS